MPGSVAINQQDVSRVVRLITDADGTPAEGVTAATTGHRIWYRREGATLVTDAGSAGDLASLASAHGDWDFLHIADGFYRVDYPDAAFLEGAFGALCGMDATGISCVADYVVIDSLFKFQGHASSVTDTTTTFPSGTTPYKGDTIYVIDGTGAKQARLVKSVAGEVATHDAWDVNISATTSTVLLIVGDAISADGGINVDVAVSSRSSLAAAEVGTEVDNSLTSYAPATATILNQVVGQLQNAVDNGTQLIVYSPGSAQTVPNELFRLNLTKDGDGNVTGITAA